MEEREERTSLGASLAMMNAPRRSIKRAAENTGANAVDADVAGWSRGCRRWANHGPPWGLRRRPLVRRRCGVAGPPPVAAPLHTTIDDHYVR